MTDIKILERIDNLIDKMEYKTAYVEIQTKNNKYILEKEKNNKIGFDVKWQMKNVLKSMLKNIVRIA